MNLLLVGLNHRTAPVAVRERYSVSPERLQGLDEKLRADPSFEEAAVVSTCNRAEIVSVTRDPEQARERLLEFLHQEVGDGSAGLEQIYSLSEAEVVAHVFHVASSLDSMVLGEAQILGQVKDAYREAVAARSCGPLLNRLFQHAFRAAKRVRTETGVGGAAVSVASVGVQLASGVFESFEGKRIVLLGAGETAETALRGLRDAGALDISIVNRSLEAAQELARRFRGHARGLDELESELAHADLVISSVQVVDPILTTDLLRRALAHRQGRPTLVIDLGVPRNVAQDAQTLPGVYVYDLDDIEGEAQRGRTRRGEAVPHAEAILARELEAYERWRTALPLVPTIRLLRERVESQAHAELQRAGELDPERIRRAAEALAAKILHRPLDQLRREAEQGGAYYAEAVRRLFDLEEDEE